MAERCDHKWELANEICTGYERLSGKQEARVQAQTLRGAVTDQFEGMGGMLKTPRPRSADRYSNRQNFR